MSKTAYMRGLNVSTAWGVLCHPTWIKEVNQHYACIHQVFISDIRACQNKEEEQKRVEKELAKIRGKFGDDKGLSGRFCVSVVQSTWQK